MAAQLLVGEGVVAGAGQGDRETEQSGGACRCILCCAACKPPVSTSRHTTYSSCVKQPTCTACAPLVAVKTNGNSRGAGSPVAPAHPPHHSGPHNTHIRPHPHPHSPTHTSALATTCAQAPLFTMKADLFQDSLFVVGYDTAVRLVKPEYYGEEVAMLLQVGGWALCVCVVCVCVWWVGFVVSGSCTAGVGRAGGIGWLLAGVGAGLGGEARPPDPCRATQHGFAWVGALRRTACTNQHVFGCSKQVAMCQPWECSPSLHVPLAPSLGAHAQQCMFMFAASCCPAHPCPRSLPSSSTRAAAS